jgi:hypothetical protein
MVYDEIVASINPLKWSLYAPPNFLHIKTQILPPEIIIVFKIKCVSLNSINRISAAEK